MNPAVLDLTCPICLEVFQRPVVLRCSHSLCLQCAILESHRTAPVHLHAEKDTMDGAGVAGVAVATLSCPVCRQPTPIVPSAADLGLTTSKALANLAESALQRKDVCRACEDKQSTCFCRQCDMPYCAECAQTVHSTNRAFKAHEMTQGSAYKHVEMCSIHKKKELSMFCLEDEALVCESCLLLGTHRNASTGVPHRCISIEEAHQQALTEIGAATALCEKQSARVKTSQKAVASLRDELEKNLMHEERVIWHYFSELSLMLDERKKALLLKITELKEEKDLPLKEQEALLMEHAAAIDHAIGTAKAACARPDPQPLLHFLRTTRERMLETQTIGNADLIPCDDVILRFVHGTEMAGRIALEGVVSRDVDGARTIITGEGWHTAYVGDESQFQLQLVSTAGRPLRRSSGARYAIRVRLQDGAPVAAAVHDNEDGTLSAAFTATRRGQVHIQVLNAGTGAMLVETQCDVRAAVDIRRCVLVERSLTAPVRLVIALCDGVGAPLPVPAVLPVTVSVRDTISGASTHAAVRPLDPSQPEDSMIVATFERPLLNSTYDVVLTTDGDGTGVVLDQITLTTQPTWVFDPENCPPGVQLYYGNLTAGKRLPPENAGLKAHDLVVGDVALSAGTHTWKLHLDTLGEAGSLSVGVLRKPAKQAGMRNIYGATSNGALIIGENATSPNTGTDGEPWLPGDVLSLTLNCASSTLVVAHERTGHVQVINGLVGELVPYVNFIDEGNQCTIVEAN